VATNHNFRIKNGLEVGGTVIVSSDGVMTIPTDSTGSTQDGGTNNTRLATTAFVQQEITSLIGGAPGSLDTLNELAAAINDDSSYATTLTTALGLKAPKASPTFTGTSTFTDSIDLAYSSALTNFYLFCNRTASQTLNIASYALDAGTDTYINIGKNTGTNSGTTTTVSIGDDASGSLVQTLGNFKTWGTITATSGISIGSTTVIDGSRNLTNIGTISSDTITITTSHGNLVMGPANTSYCHINTDRPQFYFNKKLIVDEGIVRSYDEDLKLDRAGSSTARLRITAGSTVSDQSLHVAGTGTFTGNVAVGSSGDSKSLSVGGNYGKKYWTKAYAVSNTNIGELLNQDGTSLAAGGAYRFTGHIDGTGTDQSSRAVFCHGAIWHIFQSHTVFSERRRS